MKKKAEPFAPQFASPLFILREQCRTDLPAVLFRLRKIGYDAVEFVSLFGHEPYAVTRMLKDAGILALGDHVGYETFRDDPQGVLASHKAMGCRYLTIGGWFSEAYEPRRFAEWVETVTQIGQLCNKEGVTLLYHNHHNELLQKHEGSHLLSLLMDAVPEDALALEPDLGWMRIAGADPMHYLHKYRHRSPVLHMKDFFTHLPQGRAIPRDVTALGKERGGEDTGFFEFRPTGYGIMNYPAMVDAMRACHPAWIVPDHDLAYERDPFEDLALSLSYSKALFSMDISQEGSD